MAFNPQNTESSKGCFELKPKQAQERNQTAAGAALYFRVWRSFGRIQISVNCTQANRGAQFPHANSPAAARSRAVMQTSEIGMLVV
jgi:hypothetical protein